jgi:hypothetical protein
VASSGSSVGAPLTATVTYATGGADGASGVTDTTLIGQDLGVDATGMYALRSQVAGASLILAEFQTPSLFQSVNVFCLQELCVSATTFPEGTPTVTAVADVTTNDMQSDYITNLVDWLEVYDAYQQLTIFVSPLGKWAGIAASNPAYQYLGNHPVNGIAGVITTDRLTLGALPLGEEQQREANSIAWIGTTPNQVLGLYHGLASSGVQSCDARMRNYLGVLIGQIMARYVGQMLESTIPFAQADENDPRIQCNTALKTLLAPLVVPGQRQISAYNVVIGDTVNTQTSMQQGFLIAQVNVTTLKGVQFAVAAIQVGDAVQITVGTTQQAT